MEACFAHAAPCASLTVVKRSGRGRASQERVDAARRQASLDLGRDLEQRDPFVEPPRSSLPPTPKIAPSVSAPVESRAIGVLTIGEAATRLGTSRAELEQLIDCGKVRALPTRFTHAVLKATRRPMTTSEVVDGALRKNLITPPGRTPATVVVRERFYTYVGRASNPAIRRDYTAGTTRAARRLGQVGL